MERTIYALLVGIDQYPAPVNPLRGCVNDIQRVKTLLEERVSGAGDQLKPLVLTDDKATRQAIIDGFRDHLGQAGQNDVALFYYSGHGSQEPAPPEFWHLEPDKLDETLVCWDSRLPGNWDLADKELAHLIAEVAAKQAHVTIILDCCHSGSGTRKAEDGVTIRRVPTDARLRPIETFLVSPAQAAAGGSRDIDTAGGWFKLPTSKYIVYAACSADEEAKELSLGGEQRGAFSYYLLDTLQRSSEPLSYRDVFKRVNALVRAKVSKQSPVVEATDLADLNLPFLGGAIVAGKAYFTLSRDKQRGWVIDGGAVHGIPLPDGDETTILALFPFDTPLENLRDLKPAIGEARVQKIFPAQSTVAATLADGAALDPELTYKAVVVALPLVPLTVTLTGDAAALERIRKRLAAAGANGGPSLLVREGPPLAPAADLRVIAEDDHYRICHTADAYPLVVDVPGFTTASAALVVERLEHIARWTKIAELTNPTSKLAASAVQVEILQVNDAGQAAVIEAEKGLRLEYKFVSGAWQQPVFKIRLTNTTNRRLYCMLLDLTATYAVFPGLLPGAGIWLNPKEIGWALNGEPIFASVPEDLWQQGLIEIQDLIKLIVSTEEGDATLLEQADLPVTFEPGITKTTRSPGRLSTLNRLMHRVGTRAFSAVPQQAEALADWTTVELTVTTVRPQATAAIQPAAPTPLGSTVQVLGHPSLQAGARLTTLSVASRDVGNLALPALLRDNPLAEPLEFSSSRGGEPGLNVLELVDIKNHTAVTAAQPLIIQTGVTLAADEHILPVGFDGEFYLPLGHARPGVSGTEILLTRLPDPTSEGQRSLHGSIKIFFQKVVGQRLGWEFAHPLLAAATVDDQGRVTYTQGEDQIKPLVADAKRIVLYIHGIIGDTLSMTASARTNWLNLMPPPVAVADNYDLLLTFDYENINTSIENNARLLKARLAAVGLGADHGKTLHIVAHSMGGLIARWLIEREGGNRSVQHLVMLGTPNAGSPWSTVQDWATVALGIGLNGFAAVAWPVKALGSLVSALETVDVSLDQMQPDSEFLQTLASSADPGVAYTIIAGNTSLVAAALKAADADVEKSVEKSTFARLWAKIQPKQWLHTATGLAFFGADNDMAASVESIHAVPDDRSPKPVKIQPVACDHVTYFSTAAGLQALAAGLEEERDR